MRLDRIQRFTAAVVHQITRGPGLRYQQGWDDCAEDMANDLEAAADESEAELGPGHPSTVATRAAQLLARAKRTGSTEEAR